MHSLAGNDGEAYEDVSFLAPAEILLLQPRETPRVQAAAHRTRPWTATEECSTPRAARWSDDQNIELFARQSPQDSVLNCLKRHIIIWVAAGVQLFYQEGLSCSLAHAGEILPDV
jgi:hypothetical protein